MKKRSRSLPTFRGTLLRLVFLPSLLLFLGIVGASWFIVGETGSVGQKFNDQIAQGLGAQVAAQLDDRSQFLDRLAAILDVTPPGEQLKVFGRLASLQPFFEGLFLLDPQSVVRAEWPPGRHELGFDFSGQAALRLIHPTSGVVWSDSYISSRTGRSTVSVAKSFAGGILFGDLDLEPLALLVTSLAEGTGTIVYLVDTHGTYLGHPNIEQARRRMQDWEFINHRRPGATALTYVTSSGPEALLVSAQTLAPGWSVLVSRPVSAIYQPLTPALALLLPLVLLFGVGAFLMVLFLDRHLLGALAALRLQTEGLSRGEYTAGLPRTRYLELNAILDSFDSMRQSIWSREQDLKLGERRYRRMFEDAAIGILHTSYQGELLDVNQAMAQLLGYAHVDEVKKAYAGQTQGMYVRPEERTAILRMLQESADAKVRLTTEFFHRSGKILTVNLILARVFDTQRGEFILETFAEDVTELQRAEQAIRNLNQELEAKVIERTQHLQKALEDLETAQSHLVRSEKMAALGHLIAGIAHDVNTPLGAIHASNETISGLLRRVFTRLPEVQQRLSPELLGLQKQFYLATVRNLEVVPSATLRSRRKETQAALKAYALNLNDETVESLVELGIKEWEPWLPLLQAPEASDVVHLTYDMVCLEKSCGVIAAASDKAAKVINALLTYSHHAQESTFERVNLGHEVESVLMLFQNRFKGGLTVKTSFDSTVCIWGLADKLARVWTNLISNALQSMGVKGCLELTVGLRNGAAMVSVVDDGPGIPEDIQSRIFDPFFTTKKAGEGSGLGLEICQQIVADHHGSIRFESRPGRTEFVVEFPDAR